MVCLEVFTSKLALKFGSISRRITRHSNSENQAHSEVGTYKWKLEVSLRIEPSLFAASGEECRKKGCILRLAGS